MYFQQIFKVIYISEFFNIESTGISWNSLYVSGNAEDILHQSKRHTMWK